MGVVGVLGILGIVGVDGSPLTVEVWVVNGNTVVVTAVNALITVEGAFNLPPVTLANEKQIAICFAGFPLSSKLYLLACITSGTNNPGHRNMKATVCTMRSSLCWPLPDMFRKIFGQWEQSFSP
jgi:hypothetical protein